MSVGDLTLERYSKGDPQCIRRRGWPAAPPSAYPGALPRQRPPWCGFHRREGGDGVHRLESSLPAPTAGVSSELQTATVGQAAERRESVRLWSTRKKKKWQSMKDPVVSQKKKEKKKHIMHGRADTGGGTLRVVQYTRAGARTAMGLAARSRLSQARTMPSPPLGAHPLPPTSDGSPRVSSPPSATVSWRASRSATSVAASSSQSRFPPPPPTAPGRPCAAATAGGGVTRNATDGDATVPPAPPPPLRSPPPPPPASPPLPPRVVSGGAPPRVRPLRPGRESVMADVGAHES